MWNWIAQNPALVLFLTIGAFGFLIVALSFFFGELHEAFDTDGDFEAEMDSDLDGDLHDGSPGIFSLKVISVFLAAFGGFGAIAMSLGLGVLLSMLAGLAGGFVLAAVVWYFAKLLYSQQATSQVDTADLIGRKAEVIISIPAQGLGQVRCLVGESMIEKIACARDGDAIPQRTEVLIEDISGDNVIVSRW